MKNIHGSTNGKAYKDTYGKLGVHIPEILLPAKGIDLKKWAVIACDQYTSQPEYWRKAEEEIGSVPSALKLIFPEVYLKDGDRELRIENINKTMEQYLKLGILEPQSPGFILVDRSTPHAASRKGLVLALDLERYDYRAGSQSLIRATEGTVLDRIPPRLKIRENAPIELPHIMVLIDDPGKTVIEALYARADRYELLYDFDLMRGGGHIRGWKVDDDESLAMAAGALEQLLEGAGGHGIINTRKDASVGNAAGPVPHAEVRLAAGTALSAGATLAEAGTLEGMPSAVPAPMLFAVGDGNHSLATARAHWDNVKTSLMKHETGGKSAPAGPAAIPEHPARYALVEVVNVHDDGLVFEPIHRVLFGVDGAAALEEMKRICVASGGGCAAEYRLHPSRESMEADLRASAASNAHLIPFILEGRYGLFTVRNPSHRLEAGTLQNILDEMLKSGANFEIDYIHGDDVVTELGSGKNRMGFYLPAMDKRSLFPAVVSEGALPRKTFSIGEAEEKRYYLECRRIR